MPMTERVLTYADGSVVAIDDRVVRGGYWPYGGQDRRDGDGNDIGRGTIGTVVHLWSHSVRVRWDSGHENVYEPQSDHIRLVAGGRIPVIGDRIRLASGLTGTVYATVCERCRLEDQVSCHHTPILSFTLKRDDGVTGGGALISEAPYNGGLGWLVSVNEGYTFLAPAGTVPTSSAAGVEFSPDMGYPLEYGPVSDDFPFPSIGDYIYVPYVGECGKVFSRTDSTFTVYFPSGKRGTGESIPFAPYNGRTGYIFTLDGRIWSEKAAIIPANSIVGMPLRSIRIESAPGPLTADRGAIVLRRKLKCARLAGLVGKMVPAILKKGKLPAAPISRYRVSLRAHSTVFAWVPWTSDRKTFLRAVKRTALALRFKLRREKGRDTWAAFSKIPIEKASSRLSLVLAEYRKKEIRKNKRPTDDSRYVGVEIECLIPGCGLEKLEGALIAAKLHKHVAVHEDGSVEGSEGESHEVVVMDREENIKETVKKVCAVLSSLKATVNRTCGLHVHLDMRGKTHEERKIIYGKLVRAHNGLYAMLPATRKDNRYCRTNPSPSDTPADRYYAVNWAALSRHQTIEVRSHSGTVDPEKINNWIELIIAARDASVRLRAPSTLGECLKWLKVRPEIQAYALEREKFFKDATPVSAAHESDEEAPF